MSRICADKTKLAELLISVMFPKFVELDLASPRPKKDVSASKSYESADADEPVDPEDPPTDLKAPCACSIASPRLKTNKNSQKAGAGKTDLTLVFMRLEQEP